MLVLFETAAGFALFKLLDEKKLKKADDLHEEFSTPEKANKILQLQDFQKFANLDEALVAGLAIKEGTVSKPLKKLLKKNFVDNVQEKLLVWDPKLGTSIKDKMGISVSTSGVVGELMRCIKSKVESLIPGFSKKELSAMSLGLAHSLSRYHVKFSPEKVDTMVVQAVSLLDDIDKEVNNYVMRAREWYGWHFPELGKLLDDNVKYVKCILAMGTRDKAVETDFSAFLSPTEDEQVKASAEVSMGTEMAEDDIINVTSLCDQIVDLSEYQFQLHEYLKNRMQAIAPNVNILVGEKIGARLVSHAGSLVNLAKQPASTIQIYGAEKALFSALKSRSNTPKYGLIYHASLVSDSSAKNKGKMSRMLAAKVALAARYDALGEEVSTEMGVEHLTKLSLKLKRMEQGHSHRISGKAKSDYKTEKQPRIAGDSQQYKFGQDSTMRQGFKRPRQDTPSKESEQPFAKKKKFGEKVDDEEPED